VNIAADGEPPRGGPDGRPAQVAVVGTGLMGTGIGLCFASHGAAVTYVVRDLARAERTVQDAADELAGLGLGAGVPSPVGFCTDLEELADSDVIIESITEDLGAKVQLFSELSRRQPRALLCSNTSSLRITDIAKGAERPERVVGMHFWYPPPLMPLVELVPGAQTSDSTMGTAVDFLSRHGKVPIRLRFDHPGFVWNRLVVAVLREAKAMVDLGLVSAREVDLVVEQGLARRWALTGPFASAVIGGVDTFETVGRNLLPDLATTADLDGLAEMLDGYVDDRDALARWRNGFLADRTEVARWT
jgi:3-hydroxybutyryl-CoA dehydrogenase